MYIKTQYKEIHAEIFIHILIIHDIKNTNASKSTYNSYVCALKQDTRRTYIQEYDNSVCVYNTSTTHSTLIGQKQSTPSL